MKLSILLLTAMALLTVPLVVGAADDTPVLVPSLVVGLRHSQNQGPCELGWNFPRFLGGDLGASAGTGFSWMMIPDNPTADPAARNLPAGIVLALRHSQNQNDPRLTAFGHDPVTGQKSLPGFLRQSGGDRGGRSGVGYYWYESTGENTTPEDFAIIDKLPKGTIVGLKHSLNQQGKTFSWHGVTYDAANPKLPAPRGFTRMVGGDLKAPAGQGYYWYQKVECPCPSGVGVGTCVSNGADPFDTLPESIDDAAKTLAVVFDFDTDSCYPSPAVSRLGQKNGGLKASGPITGQCRERAQLTNSNTYYRKKCVEKESVTYCVHMYALYFMKDQARRIPGAPEYRQGHRHDWEYALLWTRNGELTHATASAHKGAETLPTADLHFDSGAVVYEHNDYAGRSQVLDVGRYDVGQLSIGNDRISSVKVPPGWKVTLYAEAGFWGNTRVLAADTRALPDFDERTSSIVIERSALKVKIVYHRDEPTTHIFRFAKKDEMAENHLKIWITPTLVDWHTMTSDNITTQELRRKFNQFDYGKATCQFNDSYFETRIAENAPAGYPF